MLYQRYFLRMNQTNITHLLGLLLALALALMMIQIRAMIITATYLRNSTMSLNDESDIRTYYKFG